MSKETPNSEPHFIDADQLKRSQFRSAVLAERVRQKDIGFSYKHDKKAGVVHLLNLAYRFIYEDDAVKAAAMIMAVRDIIDKSRFKLWNPLTSFICGMALVSTVWWATIIFK